MSKPEVINIKFTFELSELYKKHPPSNKEIQHITAYNVYILKNNSNNIEIEELEDSGFVNHCMKEVKNYIYCSQSFSAVKYEYLNVAIKSQQRQIIKKYGEI